MTRSKALLLVVLLAMPVTPTGQAAVAAAVALPYLVTAPVPLQENRPVEFLGFARGEERRYVLGPPEALNPNESASWTIRLESVEGTPPVGRFSLTHERHDPPLMSNAPGLPPIVFRPFPIPIPRGSDPAYRDPVDVALRGRVRLNHRGFPLEVSLSGTQRFSKQVHEIRVDYTFEEDGYIKDVVSSERDWSIKIPIGIEVNPESDPPAGLYVFFPTDMHCLGRGSILHYLADQSALTPPCDTPLLLFANPGLLSLALAQPWAVDEEMRHLWFFTPCGPLLRNPGTGRPPGGGASPSAQARDESHYYVREGFEPVGYSITEIGEQRLTALEIAVEGAIERIYLDDAGRVLRVDLGPHPITSLPRWIRLLAPSEY